MPRLKLAERTPPPDRARPTRFGGGPEPGSGGGGRPTAWRRVATSFISSARTSFQPAIGTFGSGMGRSLDTGRPESAGRRPNEGVVIAHQKVWKWQRISH